MGRSLNNSHSSLLANPTMVSSISKDGGTRHSASALESTPQTATVTRDRAETSIMEKLQLIVAHLSGVSKWKDYHQVSVRSSWHYGDQVQRESTTEQCRDGWNIAEDRATIPNIQL